MIPHGFILSMRSKIILRTAITGMERNIPEMPHIISPLITPSTVISAFILTFEPTTMGNRMLLSIKCITTSATITSNTLLSNVAVAKVIRTLRTRAIKIPMYGMILSMPVISPSKMHT
jgi:hypothetical protein